MRLRILLPTEIMLDREVEQIALEAVDGGLSIYPRHIDFTTVVAPGILAYRPRSPEGDAPWRYAAVAEGVLVKHGDDLKVSTRQGVLGQELETLRETVEKEFRQLREREQHVQVALARMEANFIERFMRLEENR